VTIGNILKTQIDEHKLDELIDIYTHTNGTKPNYIIVNKSTFDIFNAECFDKYMKSNYFSLYYKEIPFAVSGRLNDGDVNVV